MDLATLMQQSKKRAQDNGSSKQIQPPAKKQNTGNQPAQQQQ